MQVQSLRTNTLFDNLFPETSYLDSADIAFTNMFIDKIQERRAKFGDVPGRVRRLRSSRPAVAGTTDEDGNFTFSLDVPGIPAEAISCELVEDLLTVKGEHEGRSLDRSYRVNSDKVSAKYENGVLKLTLKATPKQKPLQIPVTVD